jgi:hypothetical protein
MSRRIQERAMTKKIDRHRPHKMVRVPEHLHGVLQQLAEKNLRPISGELSRILMEEFQRNNLWPPKKSGTST